MTQRWVILKEELLQALHLKIFQMILNAHSVV